MNVMPRTAAASAPSRAAPDLRQQISGVMSQITKLSSRLQELMRSGLPQQELEAQSKLIQTQIQALQARLMALLREQAERATRGQSDSAEGARTTPRANVTAARADASPAAAALPPGVLAVA